MKRAWQLLRGFWGVVVIVAIVGAPLVRAVARDGEHGDAPVLTVQNESGWARTINVAGFPVLATDNPFFQQLGTNGRSCVTCHQPQTNMTVSAASVRARFDATGGTDPIFRPNDGATSPLADVSTVQARRQAYSMLLAKGVIRVGISIPQNAEFELLSVQDPYGYAGHNDNDNELSLFRRPLPATNLPFVSTVMWDGRETVERGSAAALHFDFGHQANDATVGHAQGSPIDQATSDLIVAYETGLYTAQVFDRAAGTLHDDGARGGPENLSAQVFTFGENDPLGCDPSGLNCTGQNPSFNPLVFTEFDAWMGDEHGRNDARAAVARGENLFNTLPIHVTGVSGINDDFKVGTVTATCSTCHDSAHAGSHSVPAPLDVGVADPPVPVAKGGDGIHNRFGLAVGDMPVYVLRNTTTGETKVTTDPGRALITGLWKDVGRFKGPTLRGLAGRAPYFHNGAAATLVDVLNFYNVRFGLGLSDQQKGDLVAFLRSL